jgi:hypothetical protein
MVGPKVKPFAAQPSQRRHQDEDEDEDSAEHLFPAFLETLIEILTDLDIQCSRPHQISVNQYIDATKGATWRITG